MHQKLCFDFFSLIADQLHRHFLAGTLLAIPRLHLRLRMASHLFGRHHFVAPPSPILSKNVAESPKRPVTSRQEVRPGMAQEGQMPRNLPLSISTTKFALGAIGHVGENRSRGTERADGSLAFGWAKGESRRVGRWQMIGPAHP